MDILFSFEGDRIRFFYLKRFELIQEISKAICYLFLESYYKD